MNHSKVLWALYFLGVVAIPFDGLPGPGMLGELAHEGSFFFFAPALFYAAILVTGGFLERSYVSAFGLRWVMWSAILFLCYVSISGFVNLGHILSANFHDRNGLPKFLTSAGVLAYGFTLAWLTAAVVGDRRYERLIVPLSVSALICLAVSAFEKAGLSGLNLPPFQTFYSFVHSGTDGPAILWDGSLNLKMLDGWDKRLRSVSFEPPAFGNFAGLVWPWLACGAFTCQRSRRTLHIALLAAFTALIVVAQARTGWLILAANLGAFAALWIIFLPRGGNPSSLKITMTLASGAAALLAGIVYYTTSYDALVHAVVEGESISDLSRLAYQVTALKMFTANPLVGVGLGQFAFGASDFMPSWGFFSSEIRASLVFPDAPWPTTYSLYGRIAAEMGVLGLVAWLGIWAATARAVYNIALSDMRASGRIPWDCYAILMSIVAILASGIATDTFRTPLIWITLGVAADVIGRARIRRPTPARLRHPVERRVDAALRNHVAP